MNRKRTTAKLFALGLSSALIPCMALAINAPTGDMLERVDTTLLGAGQEPVQKMIPATMTQAWVVQVGAYATRDLAQARLAHVAALTLNELRHASPVVTLFEFGKNRVFYRARFTGLSEQEAWGLCVALSHLSEPCFTEADETSQPSNGGITDAAALEIRATGVTDVAAATIPANDPDQATAAMASANNAAQAPATAAPAGSLIEGAAMIAPAHPGGSDQAAPSTVTDVIAANNKTTLLNSGRQVSNDELSDMRGGFFTAAGAQFDFGASVQTLVNGQLALQTNVQWTPAGSVTQQLSGLGASIQSQVAVNLANAGIGTTTPTGTTPATTNNMPAVTGNTVPVATVIAPTVPTVTVPTAPAIVVPTTPNVVAPVTSTAAPAILSGVQIQSPTGGSTQVFANVNAGQIQNFVLNSASNQTITQNTNVTLTIYNFAAWQQQVAQNAVSSQLAHDIMAASGLSRGH